MANLIPFGSYTPERAQKERKALDDERGGDLRELKVGKNILRIMPPPAGKDTPFLVTHLHYLPSADGKKTIVVTCPRMATRGQKACRICELSDKLKASGNPADRDKGYSIAAKRRIYMNVIDRKNPEKGVQIQPIPQTVHDKLIEFAEDPDDPCDFTHPLEGYDVVITRKGTGLKTEYSTRLKPTSQLHTDTDQMNVWISGIKDMARYAQLSSDKEIMAALRGERLERKQLGSGSNERPAAASNDDDDDDDDVIDADYDDSDFSDEDLPDGF